MPPKKCSEEDMKSAIREKGFTHISTADDGNCLYHSIRKYATKMGDHRFDGKDSDDLRQEVAVAMKDDIDRLAIFSGNSNSNMKNGKVNIGKKKARISKEINTYATDLGAWAAEVGDQAPIYTSKVFNIRLHIHRWSSISCAFVQDTVINPSEIGEGAHVPAGGAGAAAPAVADDGVLDVHLIHIDNMHYEVMFPKKAPATRKKPANKAKNAMKTLKNEAVKAGIRVKGRTNEEIMKNLTRLLQGATIESGSSSSSSSSSSGTSSALRRSRRIKKLSTLPKRPPTPPKGRETRKKSTSSPPKKSSETRKPRQPTIAEMREFLGLHNINTNELNANTVRALFASMQNA